MKIINILIVGLLGLSLTISCDNFLTVKPRNTKVIQSVEDYRDLLGSYMLLLTNITSNQQKVFGAAYLHPVFDMSFEFGLNTGETILGKTQSYYYDKKQGAFTGLGVSLQTWMGTNDRVWNQYYSFLGPINLIISGIDEVESDNDNLRHIVQGEALVWRAFSYFKLLQYYAPYKENKYGLPVYLKPYEEIGTAQPPRLTQKEVYQQIIRDCEAALRLLDETRSNPWNVAWRGDFIHAMMSSVYFYKAGSGAGEDGDWELAADYAAKAMAGKELTDDPEVLRALFDGSVLKTYPCDEAYIQLIDGLDGYLFKFGKSYNNALLHVEPVKMEYKTKYRDDDIRKWVYFMLTETGEFLANKYSLNSLYKEGGGVLVPFRLAEMYLNRAEALVMIGRLNDAKSLLEIFRTKRYQLPIDTPVDRENLLQEIRKERELEFFQENDFRWLEMKRLGIRMERVVNGMRNVLQPDDFRYTFPIPNSELKLNRNMFQNPNW